MKKLLSIVLFFLFALNFYSCKKETIVPVSQEQHSDQTCGFFDYDTNSRDLTVPTDDINDVTDPDEDEDFDGDKGDTVTDPDEDEDFDGDK